MDSPIIILTTVLVGITAFYAWVSYRILKANEKVVAEMRYQAEQINRPYVQIALTHTKGSPLMKLSIKNTGKTPAKNLSLKIDKDIFQFGENKPENNLRNFSAFTDQIDGFAPGQELEFYLSMSSQLFGKNANRSILPLQFKITARYSFGDKSVLEENPIDLRPVLGTTLDRDDQTLILEKIQKSLKAIAQSVNRLT